MQFNGPAYLYGVINASGDLEIRVYNDYGSGLIPEVDFDISVRVKVRWLGS